MRTELTWNQCTELANELVGKLNAMKGSKLLQFYRIYPVPRGGIPAAMLIQTALLEKHQVTSMVEDPNDATVIFDDVIDSGATLERFSKTHPSTPFLALVSPAQKERLGWVVFPWERMTNEQSGVEENITRILQHIGENPKREGLRETPGRVARSYSELFSGYKHSEDDVAKMLKTFADGVCDEMVVLKDIAFTSFCEHHMLPFSGVVHVAYLPDQHVVGVSKLARLVDVYSRRLQIQERLTEQITRALMSHVRCLGAACVIEAKHSCMGCRGVRRNESTMVTSSLTGPFRDDPAARAEFFAFVR